MTDDQFRELCNTYGFAPSRALRELIDCAVGQAALAEPTVKESLQVELVPEPKDFDHAIGADRFKVVRGAFWWHVLIGDSPTEHGKFRSRASAEKMAADLLREFRNGAFVQHETALAEPVQEPDPSRCPKCGGPADNGHDREVPPNAYHCTKCMAEPVAWRWGYRSITTGEMDWRGYVDIPAHPNLRSPAIIMQPLYTAPPQRKPLTEEELDALAIDEDGLPNSHIEFARAIERAHGIT